MTLSRRLVPALLVALALVLAACGSGDDEPASATGGGSGAFPVSIEHQYGSTTLEERPKRVLTLGLSDQDSVLALGVKPVALSYWYGDEPYATWPWAQDELGDAEPVVLAGGKRTEEEPPFEEIASLEPDLILSLYNGTTKEQYDLLSRIAPTVVPTEEFADFKVSWQESLRVAGEALGRQDRAKELTDELEGRFAEVAERNPEFEGTSVVLGERFEPGVTVVRGNGDPRMRFLSALGFELDPALAADANEFDEISVSDELMDRLDQDLLIWNIGFDQSLRQQIEAAPLHDGLDVVRGGHELFVDDEVVSGALGWGTVLSLGYALEELEPELARTVKGS